MIHNILRMLHHHHIVSYLSLLLDSFIFAIMFYLFFDLKLLFEMEVIDEVSRGSQNTLEEENRQHDVQNFDGSSGINNSNNVREPESETMEAKERSEIDISIQNLKHALLSNLEQVIQRTSKEPSQIKERKANEKDNNSEAKSNCRTGRGNERRVSTDERSGSLREFTSIYLKERQSILETVKSVMKAIDHGDQAGHDSERGVISQQQMQIWVDIATDLDGYYLEILNRYLREGKITAADMNTSTLLTHRLSDGVVNDLNRSRQKQVFSSREDIHDDIVYGQFQSPFDSSDNKFEKLILGLLSRTNIHRKLAVGFHDGDAAVDKEVEADDSDCGWSDSSRDSQAEREGEFSTHANVVRQFKGKTANPDFDRQKQSKVRYNNNHIINGLKEDNIKLMEALETYDEYKANTEKRHEQSMNNIVADYEHRLKEQKSEIIALQQKVAEYEQAVIDGKIMSSNRENLGIYDEKQFQVEANLSKLTKCFDEAYRQLKIFASSTGKHARTAEDSGCIGLERLTIASDEESQTVRTKTVEQQDIITYFCEWLPERLLELCKKYNCIDVEVSDKNDKNTKSIIKYMDDLIARLFESANTYNETVCKLQANADHWRRDFKKMKSQYTKTKRKLESIVSQKEDLEAKVLEKDDMITSQAGVSDEREREIHELRSINESLAEDLRLALESLDSKIERLQLLEEDLNHSLLLEKETSAENEWLFEMMTENSVDGMTKEVKKCETCELNEFCVRCVAEKIPFD